MVKTRSKAGLEPNASSDSDAPEQVTLSSGREEAQQIRREERENQKRVRAEAKQRRQRNIAKQTSEVPSDKQEVDLVADALVEASASPAQNGQYEQEFKLSGKITGFLDTSIIDLIAAQERKGKEVTTSAPEDKNSSKRKRIGKRKADKDSISSSRVKVVLLGGDQPSSANFQSALEFKNKRLFGEGVHRSLKMLSKPTFV